MRIKGINFGIKCAEVPVSITLIKDYIMSSNLNFNVRFFSLFQVNILIIHKQLHATKQQKELCNCLSEPRVALQQKICCSRKRNNGHCSPVCRYVCMYV
jgi:hypothetical protein